MWRQPTMQKDDRLLGAWARSEKIFQSHGDTFDIPRTSRHLAFSSLCSNQAVRYGSNVYGFQFHLEVEERMIQRWLRVEENRIEIASLGESILSGFMPRPRSTSVAYTS